MAHTDAVKVGAPNPSPNAPGTGNYPQQPATPATPTTPTSVTPPATVVDPQTGKTVPNPALAADPTKYYRPPDKTDPRYIAADPHWTAQQRAAYELAINSGPAGHDAAAQLGAANWADYDKRRATAAANEAAGRLAWLASKNANSTQTGVDAPVYDPDTDTFSIVDKDGNWSHNLKAGDVYAHLTAAVQKQYPDWYFGQYARQQEQNHRSNMDAQAYTNEGFAKMGQQSTRYAASSL